MKIIVEKAVGHRVKIEQTQVKREWMEATENKHAYKCFPVTQANTLGWSISFLDDIEFIWNGTSDSSDMHVTILKSGENICTTTRGNATISFYSGLFFKTDENMSIMSIVPPNYFIDGAVPFTSIISTSFFDEAYPIAWRITRPNTKILIPAGIPVATLIPISVGALSKIELDMHDHVVPSGLDEKRKERSAIWKEISEKGDFTNFYRDAVEYDGTVLGRHEKKSLSLKINDFTKKERV